MSRNDAAARPTTPRFRKPPEWRPGSSDDVLKRSRQRTPRPVAQLLQTENALYSFSRGRKLPGRIMFDVVVFANLRHTMCVAFDPALHVGSVLKRRAKLFFLLHAMRTPPRPVHLHAALPQTACERIVLMLAAVAEIVGHPERDRDQHRVDRNAPPVPARSLNPQPLVSPFSALLRHGFFISRVETGLAPSSWGRSGRRDKPRLYRESSNHHPERRRQHVDRPALQRQHLAVHHHIHRAIQLKLDAPNRLPLRQRMPGVRAIIKCRRVPDQP